MTRLFLRTMPQPVLRLERKERISVAGEAHLRRCRPRHLDEPVTQLPRASTLDARHRRGVLRFSKRPQEDCCSESPRRSPEGGRRCGILARELVRSAPLANAAPMLQKL